jgi:small-conductance mechanosensitive channel
MKTRAIFLLPFVILCVAPAAAQPVIPGIAIPTPVAAAPAGAISTPAPPVGPDQARAILDVLQNDKKRAQFVTILEGIAKVQAVQQAKAALPLAPGSVGAELLANAATALAHGSADLLATVRALTSVGLFWVWLREFARDRAAQHLLVQVLLRLAAVAAGGGAAQYGLWHALRSTRASFNRGGPKPDPGTAEPDPPSEDAGPPSRRPLKPNAWILLRRVPLVLLRLLLDLAPLAAFALVLYGLLATPFGAVADTRVVVLALGNAYLFVGIGLAVTQAMVSPEAPALRLVHMSDNAAAYITRWVVRLLAVGLFGYAAGQIGVLLGAYTALHEALVRVVGFVLHAMVLVMILQSRRRVAKRLRAPKNAHGPIALLRNRLAENWHVIAIFYDVAIWLILAFEVRNGFTLIWHYFLIAVAVAVAGRLLGIVLLGALDRMMRVRPETAERFPGLAERTSHYRPVAHGLINWLLATAGLLLLLQFWGVPIAVFLHPGTLGGRIVGTVIRSLIVILIAVCTWEIANALVAAHLARLTRAAQHTRSARLRTLLPMLRSTLLAVIVVLAGLVVLNQIGINTAPLLAGAGVVGIAIGFGSQKLVQDVITGLFLLLENAMQVGDFVSLASLSGTVEALSIRTIRLRATDGSMHIIPFSAVTTLTNATRDYAYAVLDITVGYNEEPDAITELVRTVSVEMKADPAWNDALQSDIDIWGVDKFLDNAWVLRARIRTLPSQRWAVQREFNRRLKYRFDKLAIESPFTAPRMLSTNPSPLEAQEPAP